jgi:RNA polymerase sigma-70 factor (sigma-E family)
VDVSEVAEAGRLNSLAGAGRMEALSALFAAHHRRLVGLASLLVNDLETAEDVVQEAFVALYRRWFLLRDPQAAVPYLNRVVVNGAREQLRRGRRTIAVLPRMAPRSDALASAEIEVMTLDEADRLWNALTELPRRQRQVIALRYYLDQTEAEIAGTLGVSRGSVKKHASRGVAALARRLEAES